MKSLLVGLLAAGIVGMSSLASADVLLMDAIKDAPPNNAQGLPRPTRGMKMDEVLKRFGQPRERVAPVGDPPITRWIYDDFTVYFEYQRTITSVVHRQAAAAN